MQIHQNTTFYLIIVDALATAAAEMRGPINFHLSMIAYCPPQRNLGTVIPKKAAVVAETSTIIK